MKNSDYSKIRGLGSGRGSFRMAMRHTLFQGTDHLLLIQSTGFTDDYRRLYYRDIGCVVVRLTQRRMWTGVVLGLMALFLILMMVYAAYNGANGPELSIIGVGVGLFGAALIINLVRGPTCACYVITRVQTSLLPTPQRLPKVPLLVNFLREKTAGQSGAVVPPA